MGIPTYYKSIIDKYPDVHIDVTDNILKGSHLYIDFNSIVYNVYNDVSADVSDNERIINDAVIINAVVQKLKDIFKMLEPKTIFIAMDGPIVFAKIYQQRSRRMKSVLEYAFKKTEWSS